MKKTNNPSYQANSKHRTPLYRRPWLWILVVLVIVAIVLIVIFSQNNSTETQSDDSGDEQSEEVTSEDSDVPQADDSYDSDPKVVQYEGGNSNQSNELTGSVSSKDVSDGTLTIMVNVDQYLNGTCRLELRGQRTGDTYDTTTSLSADVSTSYCVPFQIPLTALMSDYYEITITLSGNDKTGVITDGVQLWL